MDTTVENGYKCILCLRRLASKYILGRHIRLKHKSDRREEINNKKANGLAEYNDHLNTDVDTPQLDVKKGIDIDSEEESDNNTEVGNNNNNVIYANKAGWVEPNNKEEI